MQGEGISLLPVMNGSQWVGMITRDSIMGGDQASPRASGADNGQRS
jgi:predicted transcriptional regulator